MTPYEQRLRESWVEYMCTPHGYPTLSQVFEWFVSKHLEFVSEIREEIDTQEFSTDVGEAIDEILRLPLLQIDQSK